MYILQTELVYVSVVVRRKTTVKTESINHNGLREGKPETGNRTGGVRLPT